MHTIDIGVGGRFHADQLASVLLEDRHDVHVWTSLPKGRFAALPEHRVHSFLGPELIYRAARKLHLENPGDQFKMRWFGAQMARSLAKQAPRDLFIGWSSFSLEVLRGKQFRHRAIVRDSSHIRSQISVLETEYRRLGIALPSRQGVIDREEAEYQLADTIFVLSDFAKRSFVQAGVNAGKIEILPLGANTALFHPISRDSIRLPLKVVYFGSVSVRKGLPYLLEAANHFDRSQIELTVIGPVEPALRSLVARYPHVRWCSPLSHPELAKLLPQFDLFVLPTLEDGFGQTLIQAMACGLVPISTDRCGAAECIQEGVNGFVVPGADAGALAARFSDLLQDPAKILSMRQALNRKKADLGWAVYQARVREWLRKVPF